MLAPAGYGDAFRDINRAAIGAALRARQAFGRDDVLIAGSLSHMAPMVGGSARPDLARAPAEAEMAEAFSELALLLREEGCDVIMLEMMYLPERIGPALEAACASGLPVWAGFSARSGAEGELLSFAPEQEVPFAQLVSVLDRFNVDAAGVMHTPANLIDAAVDTLKHHFSGPLFAYPDSGYFKMPDWVFEGQIPPEKLLGFAREWAGNGVQVIGGCCGLTPAHIAALGPLKAAPA